METAVLNNPREGAVKTDERAGKYLTFQLGREEFAIQVLKVREIMGVQDITAVPQTPSHVKGVINLRGKVVPVVDLRLKFRLADGAEQVAGAAGQVSSSSQALAQGASEQAASLEETSASTEEIHSMTQKNAANSQSATEFMSEAATRIEQANQVVDQMVASMKESTHRATRWPRSSKSSTRSRSKPISWL